jgi:hypothetical protein
LSNIKKWDIEIEAVPVELSRAEDGRKRISAYLAVSAITARQLKINIVA